jgi:hypothetical protein
VVAVRDTRYSSPNIAGQQLVGYGAFRLKAVAREADQPRGRAHSVSIEIPLVMTQQLELGDDIA